jgi:hypothetical protein
MINQFQMLRLPKLCFADDILFLIDIIHITYHCGVHGVILTVMTNVIEVTHDCSSWNAKFICAHQYFDIENASGQSDQSNSESNHHRSSANSSSFCPMQFLARIAWRLLSNARKLPSGSKNAMIQTQCSSLTSMFIHETRKVWDVSPYVNALSYPVFSSFSRLSLRRR